MVNLRCRYFVALSLLLVFVTMTNVSGQGRQTCGQTCFGQPCSVSRNNCKRPCKCERIFSPNADDGLCASCRTEFCSCSTLIISDVPNETCCSGLRCLDSKTLKPAKGQGICRK